MFPAPAMDRLISSPLHLTRAPASWPRAGGHHHLLPTAATPRSFAHCGGLSLRLPPLAPLLPRLAAASPSRSVNPAPPEQDAAAECQDTGRRRFFQKVGASVLYSVPFIPPEFFHTIIYVSHFFEKRDNLGYCLR